MIIPYARRLLCTRSLLTATVAVFLATAAGVVWDGNGFQPGSIVSDVLNNANLDFNRVEDIVYGGAISGTGSVTKEAAGKLTLSGANTYGGGTSVLAGTLVAANTTGSATGSGSVTVSAGATIAGEWHLVCAGLAFQLRHAQRKFSISSRASE